MSRRLVLAGVLLLAGGLATVHAQDVQWIKAAYWDGAYPTAWAGGGDATRDALQAAGYEILNATQLKTWMQDRIKDKKYSVVVFCRDVVPDTVVETQTTTCTLRKYLDAGGKIVWYGDIPFYYWGHADGTMVTWGDAGAPAVLGFNTSGAPRDSNNGPNFTAKGVSWGLTQTWTSQRPAASNVTTNFTILATDAAGNACAWAKHYYKGDNFRGFVRFRDTGGQADVADIMRVAEFVSYKAEGPVPADGATGVTMPLLQWTPSSFAVLHNVYFGTTPELTEADQVLNRSSQVMYFSLTPLTPGVTYWWRVDEITASGSIITGDVWKFQAMPLTAYLPQPADKATDVTLSPTLSWAPGQLAVRHHVYFGTNRSAVEAGAAETDRGTLDGDVTSYLVTDTLKPDTTCFWRVDEIDLSDTLRTGPVWSFDTVRAGPVGVIRQWWSNIGGTAITDLTNNASYPNNPTGSEFLTIFEGPVNWSDNYGSRLYGWVYPPESGDYTFWIASDDAGELWLSTDEDPAKAVVIASVSGWMPSRDFDGTGGGIPGTAFKSSPIQLDAGKRYYIQALEKEGTGGDNVAVAWQGPGFNREVLGAGDVGPTPYLPQKAYSPFPADGAVDTVQSLTLTWGAGEKALKHELYLGTDANAVAAADSSSSLFKGSLSNTSYDTGELEWGVTFYWRVDEINAGEAESPWVGRVWKFTTANFTPVDDFESYDDVEGTGTRIYETWIDGYTDGLSGSVVGNFDPPFAERTIVHGGLQSMPMDYDNSVSPFYSQAYREFTPLMNWTGNGLTDLSLWVRGNTAPIADVVENAAKMTVSGEGSDIWNNSDQFTFVYKTLSGDGSLVARVVSNGTGSNTWAKGGMMIRATLDAGSPHAIMAITGDTAAGAGASFQYRLEADGVSANNDNATGTTVAPPYYVKIERTGDSLAGYMSADGKTWGTALGTQYIAMASPAYIGVAVSSHAAGEYRTFEFDNLKATGAAGSWQTKEIGLTRNSPQPLYVVVEDSTGKKATVVDPNAARINMTSWTEWKIPLTEFKNVSLSKVKKLHVGVGDPVNPAADGTGRVYFDDLRVTKPTE